jgi:transposase
LGERLTRAVPPQQALQFGAFILTQVQHHSFRATRHGAPPGSVPPACSRSPQMQIDFQLRPLAAVERERDALLAEAAAADRDAVPAALLRLRGIGPELASLLWLEGLFRRFGNRRQLAAYAGLAPSPWQSGGLEREQGIAKSGNPRLRHAMIELAWFWTRHQPGSALSRWFAERVGAARGRVRRIAIVALARKLLVALWRYVTDGIVPQGAVFKA